MEPADPNRHSKIQTDPVTIDLAAEEMKEIASSEAEGTDEELTASAAEAETASAAEQPAAPAATRDPAPKPAKPAGGLSLIAASLIGGVVALGGGAGLQYWGILPSMSSGAETTATLNLMSGEIEALKKQVETAMASKPEVDLSPIEAKLAEFEKKLTTVPEANGLSSDADSRITALSEQIKAAEAAKADEKTQADTARAALEMRLEALEKKASEPRDDVNVAVAIASAGLKAAIDRGGPFITELDTLEGIDPEDAAVKELKTFAAVGVPSRTDLLAQFPAVADAIIAATTTGDPNQSLTDRLWSSAFSAIKVRPVGDVAGDGPDAIVARMEDKLKSADLVGASAEWEKLPEAGKAASAAYQKSLAARIRVEELVGAALTKAVSGTKTKG